MTIIPVNIQYSMDIKLYKIKYVYDSKMSQMYDMNVLNFGAFLDRLILVVFHS